MSAQQLDKIQALEKQLEVVEGNPRVINTKQTPVFIQIPDTKVNYKHFEGNEIAKKFSVIHWFQQNLHTSSLHDCVNILDPRNEGKDLYEEW